MELECSGVPLLLEAIRQYADVIGAHFGDKLANAAT